MTFEQREVGLTCPFCWEPITMLVDLSAGAQRYVEDCEVCCRPIDIAVDDNGEIVADRAQDD